MPVTLNLDLSVGQASDEALGSLLDDLGLHQGPEGGLMPRSTVGSAEAEGYEEFILNLERRLPFQPAYTELLLILGS